MRLRIISLVTVLSLMLPTTLTSQDGDSVVFNKVDFFEIEDDGDEKKRDARLELYPRAKIMEFSHEDDGAEKELYARIPYANVTKVVYELSQHRRYGAGLLVNPFLLFSRGKKHWLTVEVEGVDSIPEGYVYSRLDKDNYRRILSALRAGLDIEVEEIIED